MTITLLNINFNVCSTCLYIYLILYMFLLNYSIFSLRMYEYNNTYMGFRLNTNVYIIYILLYV